MKRRKTRSSTPGYEERQRVCGTKVRYQTLSEVRAYIRDAGSRVPLGHYRCPICNGFHVTSNPD